jgi:hypothetical protein
METKWNQNKPKQAKMKIKKAKKYKSERNTVKQIENKFKNWGTVDVIIVSDTRSPGQPACHEEQKK